MGLRFVALGLTGLLACGGEAAPLATAEPGVIFSYPADGQLDVPVEARLVVTFSDPVDPAGLSPCTPTSGGFCVVGPDGVVDIAAVIAGDGRSVVVAAPALSPGVTYELWVRAPLAPQARNLPDGPLVRFTTRTARPRAAAPRLVAVNGAPAETPEAYRPLLDSSTVRLVFSEPLDPRTVVAGPSGLELVDVATGAAVPATLLAQGIHASLDPISDLVPGAAYELRVGAGLADLGGDRVAPTSVVLTPRDSGARTAVAQTLRARQPGDPGPDRSRAGTTPGVVTVAHPLIGAQQAAVTSGALRAEIGDPTALADVGSAIAFTIRRGQRLALSGFDVALGGAVPTGLATGELQLEFLSDAGGRLLRNPLQPAEQRPENLRAPLHVDLSMDVAVFSTTPDGNAAISQTLLGLQATGTAIATDGVLAIETVVSMELGLLGVAAAPAHLVLELITDPDAATAADTTAPTLRATSPSPGAATHAPDDAIELLFSEPVDLDRLRAGGLTLATATGATVAAAIEGHGAVIAVRPRQRLGDGATLRVTLGDVADLAGNLLPATPPWTFSTPPLAGTGAPPMVTAVVPGAPCALTGATATAAGRCVGGEGDDEPYRPFELAADAPIAVTTSQPLAAGSATLGASCGTGSVRVEALDPGGACVAAVAGTLIVRDRGLGFVPDEPWSVGASYRLTLISGDDGDCDLGELCGRFGTAANFDALRSAGDAGGAALEISFRGAPAAVGTRLAAVATPLADVNGDGRIGGGEVRGESNRAALRIVDTTGDVDDADFDMDDCLPDTPEREGCMYLAGAMPVFLGEPATGCALPDGSTAAVCVPATLGPQVMLGTSLRLDADVGISIGAETETLVMRVREPADGPVTGYLVEEAGAAKMVVALDVYMDAPDMDLPASDHDLYSKPMSLLLAGPVVFLPDGRIAIELTNVAEVQLAVEIDAPLGIGGQIVMALPAGEMRLRLVSPLLRGAAP